MDSGDWRLRPRPIDGSGCISLCDAQLGQFRTDRVSRHKAHRRQNDLPVFGLDIKVVGRPNGLNQALGQRDLVFGVEFGQHEGVSWAQ